MSELAIPVLHKSIAVSPYYTPAIVDLVASYIMSKDALAAEASLAELIAIAPGHGAVPKLKDQLRRLKAEVNPSVVGDSVASDLTSKTTATTKTTSNVGKKRMLKSAKKLP